ncbi:MAG: bifunctional transaldolase/phosoglucose isomerase [Desulfobacca sp.]|uniref:bifunctional transaldolase/phosoglucose isomerase n=1 Tax=Desulfobacca sp. TaxID=2067990 RepID=UPI00404A5AEE
MVKNPLQLLETYGQSVWLDYIHRGLLTSGELQQLIESDGVLGVTSNPAIFDQAISGSTAYDADIRNLALQGRNVEEIYLALAISDIQGAADLLRPIYDRLSGQDGFVSLEVNPHLAYNTTGTIREAQRLWAEVDRPNVFIKVPGTAAGLPAITQLIGDGINVNVTLLFGLPRYQEVAEAYLAGLEARVTKGLPVDRVASVASFFLSRIDVLVDPRLEDIVSKGGPLAETAAALKGQVAIASAKAAYALYQRIVASQRFQVLAAKGARPQRLLWASTSTKNPGYSDIKYVEPLIGPQTINTMPLETLNAYRDHGRPAPLLEDGQAEAVSILQDLPKLGIDLNQVTQQLEAEGVEKFNKPYDHLLQSLEEKRQVALKEPVNSYMFFPGSRRSDFSILLASLSRQNFGVRLWAKDPTLWSSDTDKLENIKNSLGWLEAPGKMLDRWDDLQSFAQAVFNNGCRQVVHMGMGGSSLAPLAFQRILSPGDGGLPLLVLDTTDPETIKKVASQIPLADTLFIIASKSGTTAEPLAFGEYFYARVKEIKGDRAGEHFVVITNPGTKLESLARERNFFRIFLNFSDIGGRYAALSYFGLVPAVLMALDVPEMLRRALNMARACGPQAALSENPGVSLGAILGELGRRGRNKVSFLTSATLVPLGMWLEQLLAESTGKEGVGILPVVGEPLGTNQVYGADRVFVCLCLDTEVNDEMERAVTLLRAAGQPVILIMLKDRLDLSQEFFRWEMATATAGAVLGINPFDQPNVQESKDNTNRLLDLVRDAGRLPEENLPLAAEPLSIDAAEILGTLENTLVHFLEQAQMGDYLAILAYVPENDPTEQVFTEIRRLLRDRLKIATTIGYGPRYLHSTGQFHKGGPNTGLFLLLTADHDVDVEIPGQPYTFGVFQRAQALGDFEALRRHGRRVLRLHLGKNIPLGLGRLHQILENNLGGGNS